MVRSEVHHLLLLQLGHGEEGGEEEHLGELREDVHQAGLAHLGGKVRDDGDIDGGDDDDSLSLKVVQDQQ